MPSGPPTTRLVGWRPWCAATGMALTMASATSPPTAPPAVSPSWRCREGESQTARVQQLSMARALVLAGDVELLPEGTAKVASQSNGMTAYHVINSQCDCRNYEKSTQLRP
jgi:hypothetical protein